VAHAPSHAPTIERVTAEVFTIPTDRPESDGTIRWSSTTMVVVHASGGGKEGIGYTYAPRSAAELVVDMLASAVTGKDAMDTAATYGAMGHALRNAGRPGLGWEALSAVDIALWDLKCKLLGLPLATLLGPARRAVPIYGSGGFTSYDDATLSAQLGGWAAEGVRMVKMKVGRDLVRDAHRVRVARQAIGPDVQLFVDANGAWTRKQAVEQLELFSAFDVRWAEEPVSSEDIEGLRFVRDRAPAGCDVAAGEYGYVPIDFRRLVQADCLDVLQADATRCGGITGIMLVAGLAEAFGMPMSTHCGPQIHAHVGAALRPVRHLEYFYDHARIEKMLFDGVLLPRDGALAFDTTRPGLGISLLRKEAARFAA
jgi:L-alanine-DL-glutamate epimerase-like enolase superfamily enzyme